jgi:hypothetical protein
MSEDTITYRVGVLNDPHNVGKSARTPALAKFAARDVAREDCLVLERTKWEEKDGRLRPVWTVIDDAEHRPGEWNLGIYEEPEFS